MTRLNREQNNPTGQRNGKVVGREIRIGESSCHLGENDIIHVTAVGDTDAELAVAIRETAFALLDSVEGKARIFLDNNRAGKPTSEARKIMKELTEHEKVGKIAVFGMHPVSRVIASFVVGVTRKRDVRLFKTRDEALDWLGR
jgi:hypothetical protein